MMEVQLSIGGVVFSFFSECDLEVTGFLKRFLTEEKCENVKIQIMLKEQISLIRYQPEGEDMFYRYFSDGENIQIELKGAKGKPTAMIYGDKKMSHLKYEVYHDFSRAEQRLETLVSLLPIRKILHQFDAFILHSSQIEADGKGILFTGSSGMGKSTQAALWCRHEEVHQVCNDRTIVRCINGKWFTFGFYEDGAEPIRENKKLPLGAIVILHQGEKNSIRKENGKNAVKFLVEQSFVDQWSQKMRSEHIWNVMNLLQAVPVYYLECLPDAGAVEVLKNQLIEDGVIR